MHSNTDHRPHWTNTRSMHRRFLKDTEESTRSAAGDLWAAEPGGGAARSTERPTAVRRASSHVIGHAEALMAGAFPDSPPARFRVT